MLQRDPDDNWEDAYRGLVAELESKERRWTAVESDLRHAATALAIAAMGQSDELDGILSRITEQTRDATDSLAPEIDKLAALLKRSEAPHRQLDARSSTDSEPTDGTEASSESLLDIRIIVNALTARLASIPDLADVAEQIRQQCDNEDWSASLNNVADSIAQVVSSLHAERRELEEFLANVTAQLAGFEQWAQWHLNDTQQRRDENADLERSVTDQMQDLHAEVESSDDIRHLKETVQTRLQAVTERVREFRANEARRLSEAQTRNAALAGEVSRLQKRTFELSEICGDQQNRLMLDALTKVHSRYAYEERLQREFERWQSDHQPLSFTLWDIDKFKAINDTFGHDAGDRLLRRIGLILNKHRRREDFVARIGGEEFVLLLPGTNVELAAGIAERLRAAVAGTPFNYRGKPQSVTISCGITEFRDGDTPLSVYKRADQALYEAKDNGRNRCISV
ncbi:MAG: diguanylate cyclase [Gammaproteobacteria bacterium]|jgi:diguanylate cyclase